MAKVSTSRIYVDVVEINASLKMRESLSVSTGVSTTDHMLLDRGGVVLLQGVSHNPELRNEALNIIHHLETNGILIICPHSAPEQIRLLEVKE